MRRRLSSASALGQPSRMRTIRIVAERLAAGEPVISVDTKKKEPTAPMPPGRLIRTR